MSVIPTDVSTSNTIPNNTPNIPCKDVSCACGRVPLPKSEEGHTEHPIPWFHKVPNSRTTPIQEERQRSLEGQGNKETFHISAENIGNKKEPQTELERREEWYAANKRIIEICRTETYTQTQYHHKLADSLEKCRTFAVWNNETKTSETFNFSCSNRFCSKCWVKKSLEREFLLNKTWDVLRVLYPKNHYIMITFDIDPNRREVPEDPVERMRFVRRQVQLFYKRRPIKRLIKGSAFCMETGLKNARENHLHHHSHILAVLEDDAIKADAIQTIKENWYFGRVHIQKWWIHKDYPSKKGPTATKELTKGLATKYCSKNPIQGITKLRYNEAVLQKVLLSYKGVRAFGTTGVIKRIYADICAEYAGVSIEAVKQEEKTPENQQLLTPEPPVLDPSAPTLPSGNYTRLQLLRIANSSKRFMPWALYVLNKIKYDIDMSKRSYRLDNQADDEPINVPYSGAENREHKPPD